MDDMKFDKNTKSIWDDKHDSGIRLVIPFFVVMAVLTVVSFIIPLRPTQSVMEKRNLAQFPEFTVEALVSGDYFDDISIWFSDTFPGREQWLQVSSFTSSLHGYSEISIQNDSLSMEVIDAAVPTEAPQTQPQQAVDPSVPEGTEVPVPEETVPAETEDGDWHGVNTSDKAEISMGPVIQIGDSVFNQLGFSESASNRYIELVSDFADHAKDLGVRVVSCPAPTAIGIMVDPNFVESLGCARQDNTVDYLHDNMSENVITVDTVEALIDHNDEYIYFRTDHHWTALGAYYCYSALCEEMGMDAAPLESFEQLDQGEFEGSLYWKATYPQKLKMDNVIAYIPQGDIETYNVNRDDYHHPIQLVKDMREQSIADKYIGFHEGDRGIVEITNHSLPDGPTCVVIKDSFGNCFLPFLTQNYHRIYALDYRLYGLMKMKDFVVKYNVDDLILLPYMIATQGQEGIGILHGLLTVN